MATPPMNERLTDEYAILDADQARSIPTQILSASRIPSTLIMLKDASSSAAEQYRLLAHTIEKQNAGKNGITIAVSSALAGEGKTVTSTNLAFALAETKANRVVLCDVDFRGGRVSDELGLGELAGITDVLLDKRPAGDVIRRVDKNLAFLPSGKPTSHPLGLLRSSGWHMLVTSLRNHFNFIVFDCPPICMSDDMLVMDDVLDKALIVVRSGVSRSETVKDAVGRIAPEKLVGFVLNDAPAIESTYRPYKREY